MPHSEAPASVNMKVDAKDGPKGLQVTYRFDSWIEMHEALPTIIESQKEMGLLPSGATHYGAPTQPATNGAPNCPADPTHGPLRMGRGNSFFCPRPIGKKPDGSTQFCTGKA